MILFVGLFDQSSKMILLAGLLFGRVLRTLSCNDEGVSDFSDNSVIFHSSSLVLIQFLAPMVPFFLPTTTTAHLLHNI